MALSVSCCMGTEVSVSDFDRNGKAGGGGWDTGDLWVCGQRGGGAECAARSRAPGCDDSAEGVDIRVAGPVERADIDEAVPPVSVFEEEAVLGQSFLGQGLLRGHGGVGCGHDTQVCPLPGEEGAAVGAVAAVRLSLNIAAQLTGPAPSGGDFSKPHP